MFADLEDQVAKQKVCWTTTLPFTSTSKTNIVISSIQKRLRELGEPVSDAEEDESDEENGVD